MRIFSQRQGRLRRTPDPTSMPYSECRSASMSAHCSSSCSQVSDPPDRDRRDVGSPPSYHS